LEIGRIKFVCSPTVLHERGFEVRKTEGGDIVEHAGSIRRQGGQISDYLIWQPSVFLSIIKTIKAVARRDCPVIILGEAGTAKEMVARQIHAHSRRVRNLFVPMHCGALSGQSLESQLFGHMKGSFAGAISSSLGVFRAADNGTIFLDEIQKLSALLQEKLVRVLQKSCVMPVGSTKSYPVNVRVICATSRDLTKLVQDGSFSAELYFHLNVATLELPPLRERKEDIIILAKYFLDVQAELYNEPTKTLTPLAVKALTDYSWPGNVRELANVMERAFVMSPSRQIGASELPSQVLAANILPQEEYRFPTMDEVDKKLVARALETTKGRKMAAAKLLRIDHRKLNRLITKFNLQPSYNRGH